MKIYILSSLEQSILTLVGFGILVLFIIYLFTLIIAVKYYNKGVKRPKVIIDRKRNSRWHDYYDEIVINKEKYDQMDKEEVIIKGEKKANLHGYFLKGSGKIDKIILFVHGWQKDSSRDYAVSGFHLHDLGYHVFLVDQFGHGKSDGKYTSFGYYDAKNTLLWVEYLNKTYPNASIYLYGVSMGATTVLMLASTKMEKVQAIVADSGYSKALNLSKFSISKITKLLPNVVNFNIRLIIRLFAGFDLKKIDTIPIMKESLYPILFLHGDSDTLVPVEETIKNYDACVTSKQICIFDHTDHILGGVKYKDKYRKVVSDFLDKY